MTAASLLFVVAATAAGGAAAPASTPAAPASTPAAPADAFPRKDVAALVKEVFAPPVPFCTNPRYPLTKDEVKWCALIPRQDPRCPELARACNRGATAEIVGRRARPQQSSTSIRFPSAAAPVRILLWILLGVGVAFLIYMIAKQALAQRRPDKEQAIDVATPDAPDDDAAAAARQVETDVQRLLDRARAAAARGDFGAALDDAYAALLRKLEGSGIVTVESHRTNGDHVRDVGRQLPALRPRMQAVVSNVEEVQFGGSAPTESRFRSVMLDVVGLLGERLAACVPFIVGLGLAGLLAGCSVDRDSWEHSTSGRVLVVDLLKRYGFTARERLASLSKLDASVSSLLLLPDTRVEDADWNAIAKWTGEGGTLIVAGGQRTLPEWIGATIVSDAPATPATNSPPPLTVPPEQADRLPRLTAVVPDGSRVQITTPAPRPQPYNEDGDEETPPPLPIIVRGKTPYAVERTYEGGGRAIVLADDRLLNNVSLLVDDNARLLVELLRPGGPKLELTGELTGLVSQDPITSVQRGRLAPAILQLLLLVVLFFIYKGAHFGRPVDPIANTPARVLGARARDRDAVRTPARGPARARALRQLRAGPDARAPEPERGQGSARRRRGGGHAHRPAAGRSHARAGGVAPAEPAPDRSGAGRARAGNECGKGLGNTARPLHTASTWDPGRVPTPAMSSGRQSLPSLDAITSSGGAGERIRSQR